MSFVSPMLVLWILNPIFRFESSLLLLDLMLCKIYSLWFMG